MKYMRNCNIGLMLTIFGGGLIFAFIFPARVIAVFLTLILMLTGLFIFRCK